MGGVDLFDGRDGGYVSEPSVLMILRIGKENERKNI